jgi:hypothetical protein
MKLETVVVGAKLFCVFAGTSLLTLQTGLGQWSKTEAVPTTIQWVMVIGGSLGTGLTAAGAFLSNSFGSYMNTHGTGMGGPGFPQIPRVPLTPTQIPIAPPKPSPAPAPKITTIPLTDPKKPVTLVTQ